MDRRLPHVLIALLLLLVQATLPAAAALADEAPASSLHHAHVSAGPDGECHVHDPADCIHCRVLAGSALAGVAYAAPLAVVLAADAVLPSAHTLPDRDLCSSRHARAPPVL